MKVIVVSIQKQVSLEDSLAAVDGMDPRSTDPLRVAQAFRRLVDAIEQHASDDPFWEVCRRGALQPVRYLEKHGSLT